MKQLGQTKDPFGSLRPQPIYFSGMEENMEKRRTAAGKSHGLHLFGLFVHPNLSSLFPNDLN